MSNLPVHLAGACRPALILSLGALMCWPVWAQSPANGANMGASAGVAVKAPGVCPALLDHRFPRLQDEAVQNLCQYSGKVALVVNTASYCGYTGQYEGLEKLYARYRDRGLVILGFPSNDFEQEPGNGKQIAELCFNTYGVKFPMFSKTHVKGSQANPLYTSLARASGNPPRWNFHKYLIGRDGKLIADYPSKVDPADGKLVAAIESALKQPGQ